MTGEFVKRPPNDSIYSLAEKDTVLPCRFQPEEMQLVVQVTWYRETPEGWDQIITAHHIDGQTGSYMCNENERTRMNSEKRQMILNIVIFWNKQISQILFLC